MTLFPVLAAVLIGGRPRSVDHRAVFRDFALQLACMAVAGRRRAGSRRSL